MNVGIISENKNTVIDLLIELEDIYHLSKNNLQQKIADFHLLILDNSSYSDDELYQITNDLSIIYEHIPVLYINIEDNKKLISIINNFKQSYHIKKNPLVDQLLLPNDVVFDVGRLKIRKGNEEYILTSQEYKILFYLVRHMGRIISTEELLEITDIISKKCLYVHINSLREKLELNPSTPSILITIYRKGYVIKEPLLHKIHNSDFLSNWANIV